MENRSIDLIIVEIMIIKIKQIQKSINKWYCHKQETVQENRKNNILNFHIRTDYPYPQEQWI